MSSIDGIAVEFGTMVGVGIGASVDVDDTTAPVVAVDQEVKRCRTDRYC